MIWMISANGKIYDHASSFATNGYIDWRQRAKYNVGDVVYIYCTRPFKRVMYKCEVVKHSMQFSECTDDVNFWINIAEYEKAKEGFYARLKLLEQVDTEKLSLDVLKNYGLSAAPQGPIKIGLELCTYIDSCFDDFYTDGLFTDVSEAEEYHEGHVRSVKVDKYERSSIARRKCIEYHGSDCLICGLNFGNKYGTLGEGFIHVHHLRPLHTIKKDYVVNYKDDLIPVCPNCHAMIHRIPNGESMNVDEIKYMLLKLNYPNGVSGARVRTASEDIQKVEGLKTSVEKLTSDIGSDNDNVCTLLGVEKGSMVVHKIFGKGTVVKLDVVQSHISVLFDIGEKTFITDAFDKGFLKRIK